MNTIPESDWKYLRDLKDKLLDTLCKRINDEASQIVNNPHLSQHEKFLRLFRHVKEKNEIVAKCFDDRRRSNLVLKMLWLREEHLLTEIHMSRLTEETGRKIAQV
jgi:hypothetical protein